MYNKLITDDVTIHYDFYKHPNTEAETIVLTHGIGWDLTGWDYSINEIKKNFNVLRYDFRGQGKSYLNQKSPLSWGSLIGDLEILLSYLNIEQFHLIGHSLGGNFAIELAKNKKRYLKSIVLISTLVYLPDKIATYEINRRNNWGEQNYHANIYEFINVLCHPLTEHKRNHLTKMYEQVDYKTYIEYFNLCAETALKYDLDSFNEIEIPTLFLTGEYDPLFPPRLQMMYYHYFKNSRFLIISESSSAVMIDQPKQFSKQINIFLNSQHARKIDNYNYLEDLNRELNNMINSSINRKNRRIFLKLISHFEVVIDGKVIQGKWNQRKAMRVFSYLILKKTVTRDELYEAFWPDIAIRNASNQLSVTLNYIKKLIESSTETNFNEYFEVTRDWIRLKVEADIDLLQLNQSLIEIENESVIEEKVKQLISLLHQLPEGMNKLFYDDWFINYLSHIEDKVRRICEFLFKHPLSETDQIELLKLMVKHNVFEKKHFERLINLLERHRKKDILYYYKRKYERLEKL